MWHSVLVLILQSERRIELVSLMLLVASLCPYTSQWLHFLVEVKGNIR